MTPEVKCLMIANITRSKFVARLHQLYEQKKAEADCDVLLGDYVRRWLRWTNAGLNSSKQLMINYGQKKPRNKAGPVMDWLEVKLSATFPFGYPDQP